MYELGTLPLTRPLERVVRWRYANVIFVFLFANVALIEEASRRPQVLRAKPYRRGKYFP